MTLEVYVRYDDTDMIGNIIGCVLIILFIILTLPTIYFIIGSFTGLMFFLALLVIIFLAVRFI